MRAEERMVQRRCDSLALTFDSVQAFPMPDGRVVLYGLRATPRGALKATYREVVDGDDDSEREAT